MQRWMMAVLVLGTMGLTACEPDEWAQFKGKTYRGNLSGNASGSFEVQVSGTRDLIGNATVNGSTVYISGAVGSWGGTYHFAASGGTASMQFSFDGTGDKNSFSGTWAATPSGKSSLNGSFSATPSSSSSSSSGSNGGGSGASLNLVCPGSLPSGYQCLTITGINAPVKYAISALQYTWVDNSGGVCMTLGANGSSSFRFKPGGLSSGGNYSSAWGALVNPQGQFQPTSGPYYVYTGATDPQIKLLVFDPSSGRFAPDIWSKTGCPW